MLLKPGNKQQNQNKTKTLSQPVHTAFTDVLNISKHELICLSQSLVHFSDVSWLLFLRTRYIPRPKNMGFFSLSLILWVCCCFSCCCSVDVVVVCSF